MDENFMDKKFTHPKTMDDESSTWMRIFENNNNKKGRFGFKPLILLYQTYVLKNANLLM
jgi:hypothetical protein